MFNLVVTKNWTYLEHLFAFDQMSDDVALTDGFNREKASLV